MLKKSEEKKWIKNLGEPKLAAFKQELNSE